MYERSAIVLERYFDNLFGFNKQYNLKENYKNYIEFLEEIAKYDEATKSEEEIIREFDEVANEIQMIQKKQEKLSESNIQLENERIKLFNDLDEDPSLIEKKLENIEEKINVNNEDLEEIRVNFIKYLKGFSERQKERNKYTKARRIAESTHINFVKNISEYIQKIDLKDIKRINDFENSDNSSDIENLTEIMNENGKNERVKFDAEVLNKAILQRLKIAKEEAQCYILIYDRTRKLLKELETENFKFSKYQKIVRDVKAKLSFINAEKDYIVGFLDNERMTAMNGPKVHQDMMQEACTNFDLDMAQIKNLYEILLKEISGKATKKIYKELYDNTYLKGIEEREKNFEKEVSNINIAGTFLNSNYWRLEGIKNIYNVFEEQITKNLEKDLSEFKEEEEIKEEQEIELDDDQDIFATNEEEIQEDEYEKELENYETEDEYSKDYDNYKDEYDDEDEYDDSNELEDEEDFEDEYEDDYYDDYDEEDNINEDYDEYDDEDEEYEEYDDEDEIYDEYDDEEDDDDYQEDYEYQEDDGFDEDVSDEENYNQKNDRKTNYKRFGNMTVNKRNRKDDIYDNKKINKKQHHKTNQSQRNLDSKRDIYKNNKTGLFRNFLDKMKN